MAQFPFEQYLLALQQKQRNDPFIKVAGAVGELGKTVGDIKQAKRQQNAELFKTLLATKWTPKVKDPLTSEERDPNIGEIQQMISGEYDMTKIPFRQGNIVKLSMEDADLYNRSFPNLPKKAPGEEQQLSEYKGWKSKLEKPQADGGLYFSDPESKKVFTSTTNDKGEIVVRELSADMVPKGAKVQTLRSAIGTGIGLNAQVRKEIFQESQWNRLANKINILDATGSRATAMAGKNNVRADRIIDGINTAEARGIKISPQVINNYVQDIAGIFKGGTPTDQGEEGNQYNNLATKIANLQSFWTSAPTEVNAPEVLKQIKEITQQLKEVDNKVISDNIGIEYYAFEDTIKRDPKRWENMVDAVLRTAVPASEMPAGYNPLQPNIPGNYNVPTPIQSSEVERLVDGKVAIFDSNTKKFLRWK